MKLSFDTNSTQDQVYQGVAVAGSITYRERPFEAECFDNRTLEVLEWQSAGFSGLFAEFLTEQNLQRGDLIYLRLPTDDVSSIKAAEQAGFYFMECSIIPFIRLRNWNRQNYQRFIQPLTEADSSEIEQIEAIAKSTFRDLRFNRDPNIGDGLADQRYLQWLRNAYQGGEKILTIKHHDQVAGFSLIRDEGNGTIVWRLAGMRSDLKNAGLGMMLYASTMAYCQDQGFKTIDGGISMANTPVLNVMAGLGFLFRDPTTVFHYCVDLPK